MSNKTVHAFASKQTKMHLFSFYFRLIRKLIEHEAFCNY